MQDQQTRTTERQMPVQQPSAFHSIQAFESAQRMANALARSDLVPTQFRNNLANCIIALEMAQRIGASPLAVMQNLNIIHGRPSWGAQFVIAALNSCGMFSPLRFNVTGEGAGMACTASAIELASGEVLSGPTVSMAMAEREGWLADKKTRDGGTMVSKWKTMPDMMIRYRSATYFGRLYAPHILMGMRTLDEVVDITTEATVDPLAGNVVDSAIPASASETLNKEIKAESKRKRGDAAAGAAKDAKGAEQAKPAEQPASAPAPATAAAPAAAAPAANESGETKQGDPDFF